MMADVKAFVNEPTIDQLLIWLRSDAYSYVANDPPRKTIVLTHKAAEVIEELLGRVTSLGKALEDIALLDEADGHELKASHAFEAVAIATKTLGKHPSEIYSDRKDKTNG